MIRFSTKRATNGSRESIVGIPPTNLCPHFTVIIPPFGRSVGEDQIEPSHRAALGCRSRHETMICLGPGQPHRSKRGPIYHSRSMKNVYWRNLSAGVLVVSAERASAASAISRDLPIRTVPPRQRPGPDQECSSTSPIGPKDDFWGLAGFVGLVLSTSRIRMVTRAPAPRLRKGGLGCIPSGREQTYSPFHELLLSFT